MSSKSIYAVVIAVANAISAVFSYILALHNSGAKEKAKKEEIIKSAEKNLEDACNGGTISDLIDATKKIGEVRK